MKPKQKVSFHRVMQYIFLSCVIFLGIISIIGSGGGGGDGGSVPITYTGLTTQAVITESNVELLAAGAFMGGRTGSAFSEAGAVETSGEGNIESFRILRITQTLEDAVLKVDLSTISGPPFVGGSSSGSISGPCGGTVSYSIQYNETTGSFSGTFNFNSYCDSGVVITGTTTVSGIVNLDSETFETVRFDFTNLSDGSSTMSGYIDIDYTVSPVRVDFDAFLKDNATSKVYWVSNYVMFVTIGAGYADINISSGVYYDPDYGYVMVATTTPFRVYDTDAWPSSGVMVVTGTGDTKARLIAVSNTQCEIDADLDGDDSYEWGPVTKNWEDL